MARAAIAAVETTNTQAERFNDVAHGLTEFNRDSRRAQEEFKYNIKNINLDNAGPLNVEKRRKLYQEPIKAYKKAINEAFERLAAGML